MSSWLARSIANTLRLDDDEQRGEECGNDVVNRASTCHGSSHSGQQHPGEGDCAYEEIDLDDRRENDDAEDYIDDANHPGRGVKEDLSELGEALSRQLWGVASFLAPAPAASSLPTRNSVQLESDRVHSRIFDRESDEEEDGDFVECENFTEYEVEDNVGDAVGVTEEALGFAQNIAHHPETWLDFPLSEEDEEFDDFEISETQVNHVVAIECLVPRLLALRIELCPAHMSEAYFWMVYFVLLHSRLNKHDAELLSTPQLVQARAMWIKELQKKTNPESDWAGVNTFHSKETPDLLHEDFDSLSSEDTHSRNTSNTAFAYEHPSSFHDTTDVETEKHPIETTEIQFIDKAVIAEDLASKTVDKVVVTTTSYKQPILDYEDDDEDDWLKDNPELEGYSGTTLVGNEEDVSFSDLEDDIDCTAPSKTPAIPPEHLKLGQLPKKI
nr:uncharacterized protein LOC109170574 [Ipomoea trifida]